MASLIIFSSSLLFHFLFLFFTAPLAAAGNGGSGGSSGSTWSLVQPSIGISAMHMQLLPTDRVIIFDRTDFGASNISLPDGKCRKDPNEEVLKNDCTAHSVEYDVISNSIRPLMVLTDVWCSSGGLTPDGSLVQTGGFNDGDHVVRVFNNSCGKCDWVEIPSGLAQRRWYATNHVLPDRRQIIIGGRRQFNYEFYPKVGPSDKYYSLPFLVQTNDLKSENNLYPFVFLNTDGNLFVFANNQGILLDYTRNVVLKTYPGIPGGEPRNYPSTGSAVLLPLRVVQGTVAAVEVLICGGAPKDAFMNAKNIGRFDGALNTCGRIKISDPKPKWVMETMPMGRVMGDMLLLPNGEVLIINGGSKGSAGWEYGRDPVFNPVIYRPNNPILSRFEIQNPTTIPRMYHSTAILLRDGRVLVGGNNPHVYYNFTNVLFPTDLSLETFSPSYLDPKSSGFRPTIISPRTQTVIQYNEQIVIRFTSLNVVDPNLISVTLVAPPFNTHSFSMNQRLVVLDGGKTTKLVGKSTFEVNVIAPPSGNIAPAGYYMLFVVNQEVPSEGIWVRIH